ncbi:hypothetical protein RA279_29050, partial [Pseudomonas syringae pv. tagetis]
IMAGNFWLKEGDVIMSGFPAGVGAFEAGDVFVLELVGQTPFSSVVRLAHTRLMLDPEPRGAFAGGWWLCGG